MKSRGKKIEKKNTLSLEVTRGWGHGAKCLSAVVLDNQDRALLLSTRLPSPTSLRSLGSSLRRSGSPQQAFSITYQTSNSGVVVGVANDSEAPAGTLEYSAVGECTAAHTAGYHPRFVRSMIDVKHVR